MGGTPTESTGVTCSSGPGTKVCYGQSCNLKKTVSKHDDGDDEGKEIPKKNCSNDDEGGYGWGGEGEPRLKQ